jgi:hypothetical protein
MNEQQQTVPPTGERVYERCLCREAVDWWMEMFGVRSQGARQHLRNSRVEFLKAVRSVIDDRIEHLSASESQQGAKINVE